MTLEIRDTSDGTVERITYADGNFRASIALAAYKAGITYGQALNRLLRGEMLATDGFERRLVKG